MSRDIRALNETIKNLVIVSDALEYVRNRFRKNKEVSKHLLQSQQSLITALSQLKNADSSIQEQKKQEKKKQQQENIAAIEDWKEEQVSKLKEEYQTQMSLMKKDTKGNLKKVSVDLINREFKNRMKEIDEKYEETLRGEY